MSDNRIAEFSERLLKIRTELDKVIEGQQKALDDLLTAFVVGGHVLLEGVPGVAKTLTARCLSQALGLGFARIQFTPDLMPADVTGVNVFEPQSGKFNLRKGPIFGDLLLADEINRAPAKTQSAMLEAMQERQVTIDGKTWPLSEVFMVIATQNPLEYEGTYPLPEAQLDRFFMKILIDYPDGESELRMLGRMNALGQGASAPHTQVEQVISKEELAEIRALVHQVEADDVILKYVVDLVQQSRRLPSLAVGASPRSGVMLLHAAKSLALMRGNIFTRPDDVRDVAAPVLRHRLTLTPEAQIEGLTADSCIEALLRQVPIPR